MKKIYILSHEEVVAALKKYIHMTLELRPEDIDQLEIFANVGKGMEQLATTGSIEVKVSERVKLGANS